MDVPDNFSIQYLLATQNILQFVVSSWHGDMLDIFSVQNTVGLQGHAMQYRSACWYQCGDYWRVEIWGSKHCLTLVEGQLPAQGPLICLAEQGHKEKTAGRGRDNAQTEGHGPCRKRKHVTYMHKDITLLHRR